MEGSDLFEFEFDDAGYQLQQVFAGLEGAQWDAKALPTMMSAKETVAHLAEAYVACLKQNRGEEHQWGSYVPPSQEPSRLLKELFDQREALKASAVSANDEKTLQRTLAFASNHDYYHIGQLCALRIHLDPTWDVYTIYRA